MRGPVAAKFNFLPFLKFSLSFNSSAIFARSSFAIFPPGVMGMVVRPDKFRPQTVNERKGAASFGSKTAEPGSSAGCLVLAPFRARLGGEPRSQCPGLVIWIHRDIGPRF